LAAFPAVVMTRSRTIWPCVMSVGLLAIVARSAAAQIPSPDSLKRLLVHATYVFEGVVQKWNAVADPALPVNPRHAVVHVTDAFVCPVAVGEFGGEDITIRFADPQAAPAGTRAWFFGTGWAIGDHIATSIVALMPVKNAAQSNSVRANLFSAIHLSARDALRASATAADTVVIATVRAVGPPHARSGEPRSEYQEEWQTVNIDVDSARAMAGWVAIPAAARSMTILIPAYSNDTSSVMHLTRGQRRLLLLDRVTSRPALRGVDSTATAFIPDRLAIRTLSDTGLLGRTLPNPVLGVQQVHQCARPF
jgi:hypothetical protein